MNAYQTYLKDRHIEDYHHLERILSDGATYFCGEVDPWAFCESIKFGDSIPDCDFNFIYYGDCYVRAFWLIGDRAIVVYLENPTEFVWGSERIFSGDIYALYSRFLPKYV